MDVISPHSSQLYKAVMKDRWNVYEERPIVNASELCYVLRRIVNSDRRRLQIVSELLDTHKKAIIFFNFTYEAELLERLCESKGIASARWDGHKHEPIPEADSWVYLVQYAAGDSGWNCTQTDTIIFYSQNYSYKSTVQAAGRIDRMNTPYKHLYYYHIRSQSGIDNAIHRALKQKKKFNERSYFGSF